MKFILTGGAGQIASVLNTSLSIAGHEVVALPKSYFDISNESQIKNLFEKNSFDIIINCAAVAGVDLCEMYPKRALQVNANALKHLGYYANKHSKPFLHLSTNCIFDGKQFTPYLETDIPNPLSVYGATKLAGERILFEESPDLSVILRLGRVFSEYPGCNFILKILKILKEQNIIKVVNDQFGNPSSAHHIANVIKMLSLRMLAGEGLGQIYHYCDTPETNWYTFTDYFLNIAKEIDLLPPDRQCTPITSREYDALGKHPIYGMLDCAKICTFLNIKQQTWQPTIYNILQNIKMMGLLDMPANLNAAFNKRAILGKHQTTIY